MFHLVYTNRFKKDTKALLKRGYEMSVLKINILELERNGVLDISKRPHKLSGKYNGYWEAHIKNDWLLIWKIIEEEKEIWLTRTGTHADLFQ
jgi:mRNA interferase YafQ